VDVAIVDYGSGNLHSALKAFEFAAKRVSGVVNVHLTSDPDVVARADRIVLPGVGAFADCKRNLDAIDGMVESLQEAVLGKGRPFLGICVGMQLLATEGLEHGRTRGLNWIPGHVAAIEPNDSALKVPHMGWNTLSPAKVHPLLDNLRLGDGGLHAYFVHSFHLTADDADDVLAVSDYGGAITAAVVRGNIAGTQFHPEKSQKLGLALIANFLRWKP
jgi:imidazole glycerol-phosphate synthase subunit HisH